MPQSFSNNFQQSLIFQKALSCFVETPGLLHVCFHTLKTIYDAFRHLMKWEMSVIKWEKIKLSKESDCYDTSQQSCFMFLNESERCLIDVVLLTIPDSHHNEDTKLLPFEVTRKHLQFLENNEA